MNIIQLQDRLKGLPTDALVNYVEQPMGEVPVYLALGELQRRKEMKERFQATQAEKPSVSEQLVAEAKPKPMAMGLGAMAPQRMMPGSEGVGAPQPAPQMDPRQTAASGIAANPVSSVGGPAMMAEGGIVGYQTGGNIGNIDMSDFSYSGIFGPRGGGRPGDAAGYITPEYTYSVDQVGRFMYDGKEVKPGDPNFDKAVKSLSPDEIAKGYTLKDFGSVKFQPGEQSLVPSTKVNPLQEGFFPGQSGEFVSFDQFAASDRALNPQKYSELREAEEAAKGPMAELDFLRKEGKDISINQNERPENIKPGNGDTDGDKGGDKNNNTGGDGFITPVDNLTMEEIFGDFRKTPEQRREEYRELQALYGMDPDYFKDARKKSIDLGLIEAGLRIAGGTSANPFENISKGATPALQAFAKEQSRLSGAERLENLAALKAYQDSLATDKALAVDLYKARKAAEAAGATQGSNLAVAARKATEQEMDRVYGNLQAGSYFSTPDGRKILGKIENAYYEKFLKEFQNPGKVYEGPDVYIPFKGKSFKVDEIAEFADFKVEKVD